MASLRDLPRIHNLFAAFGTVDAQSRLTYYGVKAQCKLDLLDTQEVFGRNSLVGFDLRVPGCFGAVGNHFRQLANPGPRRYAGCSARHGVNKRYCQLAVVDQPECPASDCTACGDAHSVNKATIRFNECNDPVVALR